MKQVTLKGQSRVVGKKSEVKQLRRDGMVPCVLYGQDVENVLFTVSAKELKLITHTPNSYIINLDIDGKNYLGIFHQIQFHPVSDEAIHVDFLAVSENKPVTIDVPITITGNSEGVKQGGKLFVPARKLRISGLIENLPDVLPIDITTLGIGKQISAGDLSYDNIKIVTPKTALMCAVRSTRAVVATDEAAADATAATPAAE